ncbi:hypothetical protein B0H19DRAFT_1086352 [Mycena capillaripes]|nr:hypothetical protein B0H19DRAFT_1086352 [Mycena capillaripes]
MSQRPTHQQRAEALMHDLSSMRKSTLPRAGYVYDIGIDYSQVSLQTTQRVHALIIAGPDSPVPETPEQKKITSQTGYFGEKRIEKALELGAAMSKHIPGVTKFIYAAQKPVLEFPTSKLHLLQALESIREALDDVEYIVRGNEDTDPTEPDSDG